MKNLLKKITLFLGIDRVFRMYIEKCIELKFFDRGVTVQPKIDFEVKMATEKDMDYIKGKMTGKFARRIEYSQERNCEFFVAKGQNIYGFLAVNYDVIEMLNGFIVRKLASDQAYFFLGFVFPEYRGKKVIKKLTLDVCNVLNQKGIKDIFTFIDIHNVAIRRQTNPDIIKLRHYLSSVVFVSQNIVFILFIFGRPVKSFIKKLTYT
jgi:hypothetical protein